jgi:hypothetical protein
MSRFLEARRFHAEKLCWQHQVLADPELNAFAKTLGTFPMHYLDDVQGGGWTSQPFLAERLKVDVRTIRRAFVELEKQGHLALETSRGRGRTNIYRPLLKTGTGPTPPASPSEPCAPSEPSGLDSDDAVKERKSSSSKTETGTSTFEMATERRIAGPEKPDSPATPTLIEPYSPLSPGQPIGNGPARSSRRPAAPLVEPAGRVDRNRSLRSSPCPPSRKPPSWPSSSTGSATPARAAISTPAAGDPRIGPWSADYGLRRTCSASASAPSSPGSASPSPTWPKPTKASSKRCEVSVRSVGQTVPLGRMPTPGGGHDVVQWSGSGPGPAARVPGYCSPPGRGRRRAGAAWSRPGRAGWWRGGWCRSFP